MKMNKLFTAILVVIGFTKIKAQNSNSLSSSPYSLYGLGLENPLSTGKNDGLGYAGLAMTSANSLNLLNPASLGGINQHSLFYNIGFKLESKYLEQNRDSEHITSGNFSNLALGMAINNRSGIALSLMPKTDVGYEVSGLYSPIEGSSELFETEAEGNGGLNNFMLSYGYALTDKLRFGANASLLFGEITETQFNYIQSNILYIADENDYSGFRFGAGLQYDLSKSISLGLTAKTPVSLSGSQTRTISQYYADDEIVAGIVEENEVDNFDLPLELGFGLQLKLMDGFDVLADYKRHFWSSTNQSDALGKFTDQDFFNLGFSFSPLPNSNPLIYANHLEYRAGAYYDSGNLEINDQKISKYGLSLGIGFPLNKQDKSMINLSYSYGTQGNINNGLIKENFHLLSLNFSFEDLIFVTRKFN